MPVASPIAWQAVEDALQAWLSDATGVAAIWAQQDAPQPPYPYATLNVIAGPTKVGGQDEERITFDDSRPLGEEIGLELAGLREITVSCQVHVGAASPTAPQEQTRVARDLMARAQASLGLPLFLSALQAASLSVIDEGPVQNVSEVIEDTWIGRAVMDVRFGLAASIEERTGYIEDVEVDPRFMKPDGVTEVDPDLHAKLTITGP